MRKLLLALVLALPLAAQVTFTPPTPAVAAKPGVLNAMAGTAPTAITCVLTGNAVPATAISIACTVAGITLPAYSMVFQGTGGTLVAFTFQYNYGSNALSVILKQDATAGVDVQASVNGGTATTGVF